MVSVWPIENARRLTWPLRRCSVSGRGFLTGFFGRCVEFLVSDSAWHVQQGLALRLRSNEAFPRIILRPFARHTSAIEPRLDDSRDARRPTLKPLRAALMGESALWRFSPLAERQRLSANSLCGSLTFDIHGEIIISSRGEQFLPEGSNHAAGRSVQETH
jgi:hypothetical protein